MEDFEPWSLGKCNFYKMSVKEGRQSQVLFNWSRQGPVHTMENFVCLAKNNISQQEATSSLKCFSPTKIFKDAIK